MSDIKFEGFIEIKPGLYYCEKDGTPWSNRKKGRSSGYVNYLKPLKSQTLDGYYQIYDSGKKTMRLWSHVVYEYFHGPIGINMKIDHKDLCIKNNNPENLQQLTNKENCSKFSKKISNTSGYPGVCWHKRINKWGASLCNYGNKIHLGYFDDPQEAFVCYLENKIYYHGWDSILPLI